MAQASEKLFVNLSRRSAIAALVCTFCFSLLFLRLWYLQVVAGDHFRELSENNRSRIVHLQPPRGDVHDRNGVVLARSRPAFNVELLPEDNTDIAETLKAVSEITGVSPTDMKRQLAKSSIKRHRFEPKVIVPDVERDVVAQIAARRHSLPGVLVGVEPVREYTRRDFAAHAIGYVREISATQLEQAAYRGQRMGDRIGQYGIEKTQEYLLHGNRGSRGIVVDASGARVGETFFIPERAGHKVTLTIDADVQHAAEMGMRSLTNDGLPVEKGKEPKVLEGAVVAMVPSTGEILAMVSKPDFDPNMFIGEMHAKQWAEFEGGLNRPMSNRAVQGTYPPGSVFKVLMATAGLSEGVINSKERVHCGGSFRVGKSRAFHCHKRGGHGSVDVLAAIQKSCNVFFYTVGQRLGIERIHEYATRFGLGERTGLELIEEPTGIVPSPEWKRRYYKNPEDQKWWPGETPSVSIGQGALTVTPLQVARAISALVNGGRVMKPYLVSKVESQDGRYQDDSFGPQLLRSLEIDPEVLATVKKGLFSVVNESGGTATRAQLPKDVGVTLGGKTGTAQVKSLAARDREKNKETDLAWFVAYAPADAPPELVVAVVVESGGHGGVTAAPIVKNVMETYFRKSRGIPWPRPEDDAEKIKSKKPTAQVAMLISDEDAEHNLQAGSSQSPTGSPLGARG
jgi:penicillin-binding protein 2